MKSDTRGANFPEIGLQIICIFLSRVDQRLLRLAPEHRDPHEPRNLCTRFACPKRNPAEKRVTLCTKARCDFICVFLSKVDQRLLRLALEHRDTHDPRNMCTENAPRKRNPAEKRLTLFAQAGWILESGPGGIRARIEPGEQFS